jgi:hypothetical protein
MLGAIARGLQQFLSVPIWMLIALVAIAVIVGGLIAVLIFTLLALYAFAWIALPLVGLIMGRVAALLQKQLDAFIAAARDVAARCPESCRGDLSLPPCQPE